ncbi:uncharacterized protein LOC141651669 [Silene latifolia]|uniref:uncharacterized protein LOC141651669 n=1 Tax=Silene latifolia TaxID=37657 RepID=UPI003D77ED37
MASLKISRSNSLNDSSYRVPFLWEQSPGKPKHNSSRESIVVENKGLPLPKPPPIRWQVVPNNDEEEEDDIGIDLFSLVGSLNTTSERDDVDGNESDIDHEKNYGSLSPSFMIERFLPAAAALAASSLSGLSDDNKMRKIYRGSKVSSISKEGPCTPRVAGEAYSSSKGCGLEVLFPWRVKHRVCGVKSPVREPRPRLKSDRI